MVDQVPNPQGLVAESFEPTPERPPERRQWISWFQVLSIVVSIAIVFCVWFVATAKSVKIETDIAEATVQVSGGLALYLGERYMMQPGTYNLTGSAPGYYDLDTIIEITNKRNQEISIPFDPLPGIINLSSTPESVDVSVQGERIGRTPLAAEIPAGTVTFDFGEDRYQSSSFTLEVFGREQEQDVFVELAPEWSDITLPSQPVGATIYVDDVNSGAITPGPVEIMKGEHSIRLELSGYKTWRDIVFVEAGVPQTLEVATLEPQGGVLAVETEPSSASLTIDGQFQGTTPLEIPLEANKTHQLEILLTGYHPIREEISVTAELPLRKTFSLEQVTGELVIKTDPEDAEIWINDEKVGLTNAVLTLHAVNQKLELRKEGYAGYNNTIQIQPGLSQELRVRLLTMEEARIEYLRENSTTADGQQLVLLNPTSIRMGASRRQPGRRANETFRTTKLERLFYMSAREITNAEFRKFAQGHDSGKYQGFDLNKDNQPVVNIPWNEAALYCNYLSEKDDLRPFYTVRGLKVTGFNPNSLGYRMPTEAEWAWVARNVEGKSELLHFPWGDDLPPPDRHGNYADRAAQHVVGRIIHEYNDNHTVSSPVGTFEPNSKGIYDLGGNVAEWIHDYYSIPQPESIVPILGPSQGEYHLIRGSSYLHGTIVDLRLSFRDYGIDGRSDIGFRIARFAE